MPSLKPRTAPPRSAPMLRSFFVPKISITITRTMSQCHMLREPIDRSPLLPREHGAERIGPAEDMHVDMIHLLMSHPTVVDDGAKAVARPRCARERPCECQQLAEHRLVLGRRLVERGDVRFRHEQEVQRRL